MPSICSLDASMRSLHAEACVLCMPVRGPLLPRRRHQVSPGIARLMRVEMILVGWRFADRIQYTRGS